MSILYLADGRSPTALNWISYFIQQGHQVHLVSSFPCEPVPGAASQHFLPIAFSSAAVQSAGTPSSVLSPSRIIPVPLRTSLRHWFGPLTLYRAAKHFSEFLEKIQPDLVHAMRIPYEGMVAALAKPKAPLVLSVWGNDFTLHAPSTPLMGMLTRQALQKASALHADCHRDIRLASSWGFDARKPTTVLPGGGGIQAEIFFPPEEIPGQVVMNPRGVRRYIRNDTFFAAVPRVLEKIPGAQFLCAAMQDDPYAMEMRDSLNLHHSLTLLTKVTRAEMAHYFRNTRVVVSPSTHDGTPNTLLEALACGCFPVAGDIESIREWINPGINGFLEPPDDPKAFARAIIRGLEDDELYWQARQVNHSMIAERAAYLPVMRAAARFYHQLIHT